MAEQRESIVRAVGLTKVFRDFWGRPKAKAVNDISFTIEPGEVIGLLGPNGSGKSTTVKMLLGLLYPTGGILNVLGRSPRAVETKREIGYLPEESYLYKYLTAEETLDFSGRSSTCRAPIAKSGSISCSTWSGWRMPAAAASASTRRAWRAGSAWRRR